MSAPKQSVSLTDGISELVNGIRTWKMPVDRDLAKAGEGVISLYRDKNFGLGFMDFARHREQILHDAIEDLAGGGALLTERALVVTFFAGVLRSEAVPLERAPEGTIVFKITLKDAAAFRGWSREGGNSLVDEDRCWPAIYRLIVALAKPD